MRSSARFDRSRPADDHSPAKSGRGQILLLIDRAGMAEYSPLTDSDYDSVQEATEMPKKADWYYHRNG